MWLLIEIHYAILAKIGWRPKYVLSKNLSNVTEMEAAHVDIFKAIVTSVIKVSFQLQSTLALIIFVTSSFTIWMATRKFLETAGYSHEVSKMNFQQKMEKLQEGCQELLRVTDGVNSTWKHLYLWVVLHLSSYFAKEFDTLMTTHDVVWKVYFIMWILYFAVGLILSAECSRMVRKQDYFF